MFIARAVYRAVRAPHGLPDENAREAPAARAWSIGTAAVYQTSPRSRGHPSGPAAVVRAVHPDAHRRTPRSPGQAWTSFTVILSTFCPLMSRPV